MLVVIKAGAPATKVTVVVWLMLPALAVTVAVPTLVGATKFTDSCPCRSVLPPLVLSVPIVVVKCTAWLGSRLPVASFTVTVIALTLLALPPILINTDAGYRSVDPAMREAARGMGMTTRQILWQVETPLALPVMLAGIRTATTEVIASATLAAFIGSGGFGLYVVRGLAMYSIPILLVGAIPVALLTLLAELSLSRMQHALEPPQA